MPLKVDVIRDRASLSRDVDGRWVENIYQLQIMNTQEVPHRFIIHASGAETLQVADAQAIEIPGASTRMVPVRLRVDKGKLPLGSHLSSSKLPRPTMRPSLRVSARFSW